MLYTLVNTWYCLFYFSYSTTYVVVFHCSLACTSQVADDIEIFTCTLAVLYILLQSICSSLLPIFNWVVFVAVKSSLHILATALSDYLSIYLSTHPERKYFPQCVETLSISCFLRQKNHLKIYIFSCLIRSMVHFKSVFVSGVT